MSNTDSHSNKYYGYVRVSTETQADKGYSLEDQKEAIVDYCTKNNITLSHLYIDAGKSGAIGDQDDLSNRTEMVALLQTFDVGDTIITMNTSRLWRDDGAKVVICKSIRKLNGNIISIEQPRYSLYNKDPQEFLFNAMMEILDQYDRMCVNCRLSRGKNQKARQGYKPAGRTPYGYKWSSDRKYVEVVPEEAEIVKHIFKLAAQQLSFPKIADLMNKSTADGLSTKLWSRQSVRAVVSNKFYAGILTHKGEEIAGKHKPIISLKEWQHVQDCRIIPHQEDRNELCESVSH